ncbi:MAG: GAF domain-containing protein [Timaviella obliquedivisa GSE-PSE-MK23-08B]|nr:GAF domain-containing protein [Timaviella obliquedivisa GSE-PSE-MK23-08B]
MTPPSDIPLSTTQPTPFPSQQRNGWRSVSDADLVFTQDETGRYLSFCWRNSGHRINPEQVIVQPSQFAPLVASTYLGLVRQVLDSLTPTRFEYGFVYASRYFIFDLTLSPIIVPYGSATLVVAMGRFLRIVSREEALALVNAIAPSVLAPRSSRYRQQLTQVIGQIRRSLNLETIWQQAVEGLGEALNVSRCLICPYKPSSQSLKVVAEYCQSDLDPMLGADLKIEDRLYLDQALSTLEPVTFNLTEGAPHSVLALATPYKDQPNGLIILYQFNCDQFNQASPWSDIDLDLLKEIADQVGTGVAHATLLEESRNLAAELQRANESLMERHREIEEARQQAEAASRLKSEFLANTSHELRTPLNGVIGFLKLIMDGMADDPEEQSQFIEEAHRSAIHLLSIINDILDVAKIEAGKMQLDLNPIQLDDLLGDVENFIRPQSQQKSLSLEILTPATRDEVVVLGNYQRLLQVMLNLLSNAVKFTHEGGITITAEVLPDKILVQNQEKPGSVKISVADTGIGVSLEKQDKLFQSFSQVDGSRTRQYGGTGLGLAISQKLVEAMGGVVNFYSMGEGLGSTVTFTVPLYQDPVMISADSSELLL